MRYLASFDVSGRRYPIPPKTKTDMEPTPLLTFTERQTLRRWLEQNHRTATCCWVACSRSPHPVANTLPYLTIVEEALCFGWIDSTVKRLPDGRLAQRLSPRRRGSHWTELNRQRCRDLQQRGLMTPAGLQALRESELPSQV